MNQIFKPINLERKHFYSTPKHSALNSEETSGTEFIKKAKAPTEKNVTGVYPKNLVSLSRDFSKRLIDTCKPSFGIFPLYFHKTLVVLENWSYSYRIGLRFHF